MTLHVVPTVRRASAAAVVLALVASTGSGAIQYQAVGRRGMVASAHSLATQAGLDVLKRGGNAFDAAVAIAATLNVVEPSRSGIGGVGFMTLYVAKTGEVLSLQMTGAAPLAAAPEQFKSKRDQEAGFLAGVVPGNFGGWVALLEKHGTMSLAQVLESAIYYAENGFPVDSYLAETLDDSRAALEAFPTSAAVFLPEGRPLKAGEVLVQKDLARTFRRLAAAEAAAAKAGKSRVDALQAAYDLFYTGDLAKEFVAFYRENGGLFGAKDFADYRPVWAAPIHTRVRGLDVYTNGPTSRGGVQTLMALNVLEGYDLKALGFNSADYLHVVAEAIKAVNLEVYKSVGDPKFTPVPLDRLLSKDWAAEQRKRIDLAKAAPYGTPAAAPPAKLDASYEDDPNTTHFDVVDEAGNAVASTVTIGTFGTKVVVGRTGVIFHNATRYGSFSPYKDDVNFIGPGKTPLINNSPLIALKDGKPVLVWGTPGGEGIGQMQLQLFLGVVEFGMGIQDAIESPRLELRARPDFYKPGAEVSIGVESRVEEAIRKALVAKGHAIRLEDQPYAQAFGGMQGIVIDRGRGVMTGGADPRRGGCALGF